MTIVITADPLLNGFPSVIIPHIMAEACKSFATTGGNTQVKFSDSSSVFDNNGIANDTDNLKAAIDQYAHTQPVIVLGWSRGAQLAGRYLRLHSTDADAPPAENLSFVLIGNPERGTSYGGRAGKYLDGSELIPTPNTTQYTVRDIARKGDWFADVPDTNLMTGILIHCDYFGVNLNALNPIRTQIFGNTTYYVVP